MDTCVCHASLTFSIRRACEWLLSLELSWPVLTPPFDEKAAHDCLAGFSICNAFELDDKGHRRTDAIRRLRARVAPTSVTAAGLRGKAPRQDLRRAALGSPSDVLDTLLRGDEPEIERTCRELLAAREDDSARAAPTWDNATRHALQLALTAVMTDSVGRCEVWRVAELVRVMGALQMKGPVGVACAYILDHQQESGCFGIAEAEIEELLAAARFDRCEIEARLTLPTTVSCLHALTQAVWCSHRAAVEPV